MAIKLANNQSLSAITALPSGVSGGAMTLISTTTASSGSATVSITGLNSTYKEYVIKLYNVHPSVDDSRLTFQGSTDSTNYGVALCSVAYRGFNYEDDSHRGFGYQTSADLAQSTSFQRIGILGGGSDNDECCSGEFYIFDPSSTVYVKHFMTRMAETGAEPRAVDGFSAGYFQTTSAIQAIQFKFDNSSNIDAGTFKLYGIS